MNAIEVKNLFFSYKDNLILKNLSFNVKFGDFFCITGANGTGKTTLFKLMVNLLKPYSGEIKIFESNIRYVSQKVTAFNQGFPATVEEIISLGIIKKISSREKKERIHNSLEKVDMLKFKDAKIGELSGGQQQRVFIAKSLIDNPKIIFLDEPTIGIDVNSVDNICCLLGKLNQKYKITILMITHDVELIIGHANKIMFFKNHDIQLLKKEQYYEEINKHKQNF